MNNYNGLNRLSPENNSHFSFYNEKNLKLSSKFQITPSKREPKHSESMMVVDSIIDSRAKTSNE